MKLNIEIDMTPEELRRFLGLPDVQNMQNEVFDHIRKKMIEGVEGFDPLSVAKIFFPDGLKQFQEMQQQFWQSFTPHKSQEDNEENK